MNRSLMFALVGALLFVNEARAVTITGKVFELDGVTLVRNESQTFSINVYEAGNPRPIRTLPLNDNGTFSVTIMGNTLPADKSLKVEFVRGNTVRTLEGLDGNAQVNLVLQVTIGRATFAGAPAPKEKPTSELVSQAAVERTRRCCIFCKQRGCSP